MSRKLLSPCRAKHPCVYFLNQGCLVARGNSLQHWHHVRDARLTLSILAQFSGRLASGRMVQAHAAAQLAEP